MWGGTSLAISNIDMARRRRRRRREEGDGSGSGGGTRSTQG